MVSPSFLEVESPLLTLFFAGLVGASAILLLLLMLLTLSSVGLVAEPAVLLLLPRLLVAEFSSFRLSWGEEVRPGWFFLVSVPLLFVV
jgi:hypothetical protein